MTALALICDQTFAANVHIHAPHVAATSMMTGGGVELFTTSCTPVTLTAGMGVGLFTTSCIAPQTDTLTGGGVALFTTSC